MHVLKIYLSIWGNRTKTREVKEERMLLKIECIASSASSPSLFLPFLLWVQGSQAYATTLGQIGFCFSFFSSQNRLLWFFFSISISSLYKIMCLILAHSCAYAMYFDHTHHRPHFLPPLSTELFLFPNGFLSTFLKNPASDRKEGVSHLFSPVCLIFFFIIIISNFIHFLNGIISLFKAK